MDPGLLPPEMRGFYFDFDWETHLVWALDLPVEAVLTVELSWHLDLPIWSSVAGEARFDLRPRDVLEHPAAHPRHYRRLTHVDLGFPIDGMWNQDRFVILDGVHRLARLAQEGQTTARIRRVPRAAIEHIRSTPAS